MLPARTTRNEATTVSGRRGMSRGRRTLPNITSSGLQTFVRLSFSTHIFVGDCTNELKFRDLFIEGEAVALDG